MGRLITFLAREIIDNDMDPSKATTKIRGLGIDEQTALLLDINTGIAKCVGKSYAFICTPLTKPEICTKNTPLTYKSIDCTRLNGTANSLYSFDKFESMDLKLTKIYKNSIINSEFHPTGLQYGGVPPGNPSLTDD
jgi:cyanophycinase-like exopeptidase